MREIDDYLPSQVVDKRELKSKHKDRVIPEQIVQVAIVFAKHITGRYPDDILKKAGYISPDLENDSSPQTRLNLVGLLGKNEVSYVWGRMRASDKYKIQEPHRHSPEEYVMALEKAWRIIQTLKGF